MKKTLKLFNIIILPLFLGGLIILMSTNFENGKGIEIGNFKCLKCHKGSKSLENIVKEKEINSAEDLRKLVRNGPKSGLHLTVPDEDLEKAIQYLNLQ